MDAGPPLLRAKSVWSMHRIVSMADGRATPDTSGMMWVCLKVGVLPDQGFSFLLTLFLICLGSFFDICSCLILFEDMPMYTSPRKSESVKAAAALHCIAPWSRNRCAAVLQPLLLMIWHCFQGGVGSDSAEFHIGHVTLNRASMESELWSKSCYGQPRSLSGDRCAGWARNSVWLGFR